MPKFFRSYLHSLHVKAESFQKREDLYTLESMFLCYFFLSCFTIADQLISVVVEPQMFQDYTLIFIPIGLLLIFLSLLYVIKRRVFSCSFEKQEYPRYIIYFDLLKAGVYAVLFSLSIEGMLIKLSVSHKLDFKFGYWLSFGSELIILPAILSIQTNAIRIILVLFHLLYSYFRLEGWNDEVVQANFSILKIFPVLFCLYKLSLFEEKLRLDKTKQAEERKFASKVLDLLPEGVAIIDEAGLKYRNNSLAAILRVKESECLSTLFNLENNEYNDKFVARTPNARHLSHSPNYSNDMECSNYEPQILKTLGHTKDFKSKISEMKSFGLSNFQSLGRKTERSNTAKPNKVTFTEIEAKKTKEYRLPSDPKLQNEIHPKDDAHQSILEVSQFNSPIVPFSSFKQQKESLNTLSDQPNLLSPLSQGIRPGPGEQQPSAYSKRKPSEESSVILEKKNDDKPSTKQALGKEDSTKNSRVSLAEISGIKLRLKQILDKIHRPYEKSQHKNVGEAVRDLLFKLKEQFAPNDLLYSNANLFVKQAQRESQNPVKKYVSRSATFRNDNNKPQKRSVFYTLSQWTIIMNSERELSNGTTQRLEVKFTPVIATGKPSLIILVRDVTEREVIKHMEEKEQNHRQALAAVSHEFRTPLNGILGMLDTLKEQIEPEVSLNFLMPAYNSAKLLLTLVNDILDFHQVKEQKITLIPVKFNLKSKLEDCMSLISIQAKKKGLKTEVYVDNDVPQFIYNDPNRVQQVVTNLLGNAIKFTLEGSISIRVSNFSENKIKIKVIDTGIGIEAKNIDKLFKTFGKIDSKKNRELNPQGVGLGLTISHTLAELLCSDKNISGLNVISEYQKGSTFWFAIDDIPQTCESCEIDDDNYRFKLVHQNMEELLEKARLLKGPSIQHSSYYGMDSMNPGGTGTQVSKQGSALFIQNHIQDDLNIIPRKLNTDQNLLYKQESSLRYFLEKLKKQKNETPTVLVADDNDINHMVFQNFLRSFDLTIESAYNGQQAIQKVLKKQHQTNSHSYLLVFLDIEMPTMGGLECTIELKKLMDSKQIEKFPIIGQSGHEDKEQVTKCLEVGMVDYLQKPITKIQLLEMMIKWLHKEYDNA